MHEFIAHAKVYCPTKRPVVDRRPRNSCRIVAVSNQNGTCDCRRKEFGVRKVGKEALLIARRNGDAGRVEGVFDFDRRQRGDGCAKLEAGIDRIGRGRLERAFCS
ncbi:translation elongation factor Tu [Trichinella spiralis]|uniref:translation elongation factor Tu n=1 Tax=Trichinella spiralis TaxID=6334 RepID=UPI0001EFB317|nr:translation elongation factor Tu [Trichinella spiralis]XP_003378221.1 translation elongation factor Tu [Trichinella spiralis]